MNMIIKRGYCILALGREFFGMSPNAFKSNYSSCAHKNSENISQRSDHSGERKARMKLNLPPK
jgi:hypothetical protein